MTDYRARLSRPLSIPSPTLLDSRGNKYYAVLSANGMDFLATSLSTPGIEDRLSRDLAARFNVNSDYDAPVDQHYVSTHIGGSVRGCPSGC